MRAGKVVGRRVRRVVRSCRRADAGRHESRPC
jgi:hypothetical protein